MITIAILIWIAVMCDALRDRWWSDRKWFKRHIVKWISFFIPYCIIGWLLWKHQEIVVTKNQLYVLGFVVLCFATWRFFYIVRR